MTITASVPTGQSSKIHCEDLLAIVDGATDLRGGLTRVVELLRRQRAVDGVEWWAPTPDGASFYRELSAGNAVGPRTPCALGAAGTLVLIGARAAGLEGAVGRLRPLVHHWWTAERLADHAARLARRNGALEDSAALVAHDVKSSLAAAIRSGRLDEGVRRTLEIVDSIAEAARADEVAAHTTATEAAVQASVADLGDPGVEIRTRTAGRLPVPPDVLRVVLRNLIGNAAAAGARSVEVSTGTGEGRSTLVVDDDGLGLGAASAYRTGGRAGLALCRRLVARFGGRIDLTPRPVRGTRAVLVMTGAVP